MNTHAFFTYENLHYDQLGCSFTSFNQVCINTPPAPERVWNADTTDNVFTVGLGAEWRISKKWKFGMDYLFTQGTTDIEVQGGSALGPLLNMPQLDSLRHRLGLRLDYEIRDRLKLRMSYLYEHLDTEDFALDGVAPNSVPELITLGNQSPDYDAHVFGVALAYIFD